MILYLLHTDIASDAGPRFLACEMKRENLNRQKMDIHIKKYPMFM